MKMSVILAVFFSAAASTASAETLYLKDGSRIRGTIKLANADLVEIETPNGLLSVRKERITSIDYSAEVAENSTSRPSTPTPRQTPSDSLRPYGRGRIFTSVDYYLPANAGDGVRDTFQASIVEAIGLGYTAASYSAKTTGGLGGRLGYLIPVSESVELGLSGGYVNGPKTTGKINVSNGGFTGAIAYNRSVSFLRFLVEERTKFPLSEKSSFRVGGGIGVAHGTVTEDVTCTGPACLKTATSESTTWSGLAWEFTAEFMLQSMSFGSRFAGFPKFKGDTNLSKIEWTTPGFFFAYAF